MFSPPVNAAIALICVFALICALSAVMGFYKAPDNSENEPDQGFW